MKAKTLSGSISAAIIALAFPAVVTAGPFGNIVNAVGNAAGNAVNAAGNAAGNVVNAAGNVAGNVANAAGNAAGNVVNAAGNVAGNVANAAGNAAGNVVNTVGNVAGNVAGGAFDAAGNFIEGAVQSGVFLLDSAGNVVGSVIPREPDADGYYSPEQQAANLIDPPEPNNPVDNELRNKLKLNDGTTVVHFNSNRDGWNDWFAERWYASYQMITLDGDATGAKCADGSNYKFLVDRSAKSSNILIQFEAGGGCWDSHTCSRADGGFSNGGLVGQKLGGIPDQATLRMAAQASLISGIADNVGPNYNPKFKDWTKVYLPYCSQDLGTGDAIHDYGMTLSNGSTTFQNNGRKIHGAVLTWLKENLEQPTQMLLAGQSAGGFASMLHYNLYRTALEPQKGYMHDDAGPIVPADQTKSLEEAPSGPTMIAIRNAWNAAPYLKWFEEESARAGLGSNDAFNMHDMGTLNSFLAKKWPNDRFMLSAAQHDAVIAGFSYNMFDENLMNAKNANDGHSLRKMKQEYEIGKLRALLDTLPNFGYFMPGYRPVMGGHVLTFPVVEGSAKNEDDGNTIRDSILNLLNDDEPLMKSFESNVFLDYARYGDCANAATSRNNADLLGGQNFIVDKKGGDTTPSAGIHSILELTELAACVLPGTLRPQIWNVAQGAAAAQSSTAWGGHASRAADGSTDGGNNSVTHTNYEHQPWLEVDLGQTRTVYGVTIWNRTDCCSDRLSNFEVVYIGDDDQIIDVKEFSRVAGTKTNIVSMRSGVRYVQVRLLGSGVLSLAELQVWGHHDDNSFGSDPIEGAQQEAQSNIVEPGFDAEYYLNRYGDLRTAFGNNYQAAFNHWVNHGIREGRQARSNFNVKQYLNRYTDLKAAFGNNYEAALDHWKNHGIREGRKGTLRVSRKLALKSAHRKYVVAEKNGGSTVNANRNGVGAWETFTMTNLDSSDCLRHGSKVKIQTSKKFYFSAQPNGALDANRTKVGSWEKFTLVNRSNRNGCLKNRDRISLESAHRKYVVAEKNGRANANRNRAGSWERFTVYFK